MLVGGMVIQRLVARGSGVEEHASMYGRRVHFNDAFRSQVQVYCSWQKKSIPRVRKDNLTDEAREEADDGREGENDVDPTPPPIPVPVLLRLLLLNFADADDKDGDGGDDKDEDVRDREEMLLVLVLLLVLMFR